MKRLIPITALLLLAAYCVAKPVIVVKVEPSTPVVSAPILDVPTAQLVAGEGAINFTPTVLQGTGITFTASGLPSGASINSSTGAVTGTLSTLGHSVVEITATNTEGADTIIVPVIVYNSLITVDSAWLASEGSAPYLLDTANAVYQIDDNIAADASVFSIQADGVCLDLAGNTITYNNDSANTITNQDFSNFTTTNPDNWTITGDASHDKIAAASSNIYHDECVKGLTRSA